VLSKKYVTLIGYVFREDAPVCKRALGVLLVERTMLALGSHGVRAHKVTCSPEKFRILKAGGTGIEPATCGFGALGALSSLVQGSPNRLEIAVLGGVSSNAVQERLAAM